MKKAGIITLTLTIAMLSLAVLGISSKASSRGETVTLHLNVNSYTNVSSGAVDLSYDNTVLEIVSGEMKVGSPFDSFTPSKGKGVMGGTSPFNVSGNILTVTFKIKDNAPFTTTTVSAAVTIRPQDGAQIVDNYTMGTVTVACPHSYGAWSKADDNNHQRTCSICNTVDTQAHTWNAGTVTKQATCKEEGTKTYTCTVCGATKTETISKTTNHTWGGWTKKDDNTHVRTCSVCNTTDTANHTWNAGTVTKQATCKEAGVKTFACTACNATKTEDIAKTTTHTWGAWAKKDGDQHKRVCSVCNQEETANHGWNAGTVTKAATCKEAGVKTFTCTACSATKTEEITKTTTHTWGKWEKVNETEHKRTCTVCNTANETAAHTWNTGVVTKQATCKETGVKTFTCTACSATKTEDVAKTTTHAWGAWSKKDSGTHARTCSVCGKEETANHSYGADWQKDSANHYHVCSVCGDKKDSAAHTPGAAATEMAPQTCTTCGYIITPALGHTHNWSTNWTTDANGHWHTCSGCNEKKDASAHVFDNDCDTDCSVCGFTRAIEHQFELKHDETSHWQECKVCGETKDKEAHVPGPEATEENAQVCLVCDYEIAPKLEPATTEPETEEETESGEAPSESENQGESKEGTEPAKENASGKGNAENGANAGSLLPWILGGIGLAAVAAFLIFFLLKKKKKEEK